jgi:hypothetical protein
VRHTGEPRNRSGRPAALVALIHLAGDPRAGYSVFDSALNTMRDAKWHFSQEIATAHFAGDVSK